MDDLSHLDLMFCVDLTGSMQPFIRQAQAHMVSILRSLTSVSRANLRVGVCGYRDFSEHEATTQSFPLSADLQETQAVLRGLQAYSPADNQDAAEAVFSGLIECLEMDWREHAYRVIILVGDAPPHGCGATAQPYPDRWPELDPTGFSVGQICAKVEGNGVTLYSLSMSPSVIPVHDAIMLEKFDLLARSTGGIHREAREAGGAMKLFEEISHKVFGHLEVDRRLFERYFAELSNGEPAPSLANMAEALGLSLEDASNSVSRLKKRKLQKE